MPPLVKSRLSFCPRVKPAHKDQRAKEGRASKKAFGVTRCPGASSILGTVPAASTDGERGTELSARGRKNGNGVSAYIAGLRLTLPYSPVIVRRIASITFEVSQSFHGTNGPINYFDRYRCSASCSPK